MRFGIVTWPLLVILDMVIPPSARYYIASGARQFVGSSAMPLPPGFASSPAPPGLSARRWRGRCWQGRPSGAGAGAAQQRPPQSRGPRRRDRRGRARRRRLARRGGRGLPLSVSCRGRLPAVGAGPGGDVPRQCRRHARADAGRAGRRGRAHRLYQQRRDAGASSRGGVADEETPSRADGHDRPLQALEIRRRGGGRASWSPSAACRRSSSTRRPRSAPATSSRPRPAGSSSRRRRGRMPGYVDTGLNIAHVDDVALGHLLAAERGRIGRRYILGGENLTPRRDPRRGRAGRRAPAAARSRSPMRRCCRSRPAPRRWRG